VELTLFGEHGITNMSMEKTDALIIRIADFSETSRVVTFFTREMGKVAAVAKGGRRLKGPFEAALDLLTTCRIVFIRKSSASLDILTEAQLKSRFQPKTKDLNTLYGGYYVAELLQGLTEDYDPHRSWYDEAVRTLDQLSQGGETRIPILRFEFVTLREIGHLPAFDECGVCGESNLRMSTSVAYSPTMGLICGVCQNEETNQQRIQTGTVAILQRLTSEEQITFDRLNLSTQQFRELKTITTSSVCHALGRRPKMLRYLHF
jgi:DNA repair protein RecO (recombination protein O)